jgi:hypothetical protein
MIQLYVVTISGVLFPCFPGQKQVIKWEGKYTNLSLLLGYAGLYSGGADAGGGRHRVVSDAKDLHGIRSLTTLMLP